MMRSVFGFLVLVLLLTSCKETTTSNFTVNGSIDGLRKGTLYLQHLQDTVLVNLDSLVVDGDSEFELDANIQEPEVLLLYLDKLDNNSFNDRVSFFAEPESQVTITTRLKNFELEAKVTGSINQKKLDEFFNYNDKFNSQNLNYIKEFYDAQKDNDNDRIRAYQDSLDNLLQRKYRFAGQFVVTNSELEVAPYIIITQIPDAKISFLEELYSKLDAQVQESKYSLELKELIAKRKEETTLLE